MGQCVVTRVYLFVDVMLQECFIFCVVWFFVSALHISFKKGLQLRNGITALFVSIVHLWI